MDISIQQDARRYRWLMQQIENGQLVIAGVPLSPGAPLVCWEDARDERSVTALIDRALATADALAEWKESCANENAW